MPLGYADSGTTVTPTVVWTQWATVDDGTCGTITCSSTCDTWTTWTTVSATSAITTNTVWVTWAGAVATDDPSWGYWVTEAPITATAYWDRRTPEQRAADEARYAAERERVAARAAQAAEARAAARDRARALLLSMLDVKQRETLERDQFFEVIARDSRRRYRIRQGTHGNVRLLDDTGREVTRYCAQPTGVPDEDAMLAQKLMIEHEEQSFLRVANATRLTA